MDVPFAGFPNGVYSADGINETRDQTYEARISYRSDQTQIEYDGRHTLVPTPVGSKSMVSRFLLRARSAGISLLWPDTLSFSTD